jgi:hypothetical protein
MSPESAADGRQAFAWQRGRLCLQAYFVLSSVGSVLLGEVDASAPSHSLCLEGLRGHRSVGRFGGLQALQEPFFSQQEFSGRLRLPNPTIA